MQKQRADIDIEKRDFSRVYLLYGDESFLVRLYAGKLKKAIIPEDDDLNYAYFDSVNDVQEIIGFADTLPFLGERRLVFLDKTEAFKKDIGLADYIENIPDTTTILITEDEVDKRSRLYKAISKFGVVMELKKLGLQDLKNFVASRIIKAGKGITESDCEYLIESVGDDMNTLANEVEKCIAFAGSSKAIDRNTINTVCSMQVENKIFDMVDSILVGKSERVYKLYGDLVTLRENAFGIMAVIRMNYNRLLLVKELMDEGCGVQEIATRAKMADWLVKKQMSKVRNYSADRLQKALEEIINTENSIKIGNIGEQTGIEIMLAKLMAL